MVYDFATMERQGFEYRGGGLALLVGGGVTQYVGEVQGFRSWKPTGTDPRIVEDYRGWFKFDLEGLGPPTPGVGVTLGKMNFEGRPDKSIHGRASYASISGGFSLGYDYGEGFTYYIPMGQQRHYQNYRLPPDAQGRIKVNPEIISDIASGSHPAWLWPTDNKGLDRWVRDDYYSAKALAQYAFYIYEQINYYSYGSGQSADNPNNPPQ